MPPNNQNSRKWYHHAILTIPSETFFPHVHTYYKLHKNKCYQMILNAHKQIYVRMIPSGILSQIIPNTFKYNQMLPNASMSLWFHMGLCSQVYQNAPKYLQTPPNTSNTIKCPRMFLNANRCSKMLPSASMPLRYYMAFCFQALPSPLREHFTCTNLSN